MLDSFSYRAISGTFFHDVFLVHSGKLSNGISPCSIGNTSSKGAVSIAMFVYLSVIYHVSETQAAGFGVENDLHLPKIFCRKIDSEI